MYASMVTSVRRPFGSIKAFTSLAVHSIGPHLTITVLPAADSENEDAAFKRSPAVLGPGRLQDGSFQPQFLSAVVKKQSDA